MGMRMVCINVSCLMFNSLENFLPAGVKKKKTAKSPAGTIKSKTRGGKAAWLFKKPDLAKKNWIIIHTAINNKNGFDLLLEV